MGMYQAGVAFLAWLVCYVQTLGPLALAPRHRASRMLAHTGRCCLWLRTPTKGFHWDICKSFSRALLFLLGSLDDFSYFVNIGKEEFSHCHMIQVKRAARPRFPMPKAIIPGAGSVVASRAIHGPLALYLKSHATFRTDIDQSST